MKRRLRIGFRILCVSLSALLITALGAEIVFRTKRKGVRERVIKEHKRSLFEKSQIDQGFGEPLWEERWVKYRPNACLKTTIDGEQYQIDINRFGFRCRDFSKWKPRNTIRIICIGASTTVQGRTNDETYPAILERKLRVRYPQLSIQVLNFGISGTKSDHWIRRVDTLFGYDPDIVIQYNLMNDIAWRYLWTYGSKHRMLKTLNGSYVFQTLFPFNPERLDFYLGVTLNNFRMLEAACKSKGAAYVVGSFAVPEDSQISDRFRDYLDVSVAKFWGLGLQLKHYREIHDIVERHSHHFRGFAAEHSLRHVDVHQQMRSPRFFIDACHMTPEGIELLADLFFAEVARLLSDEATLSQLMD